MAEGSDAAEEDMEDEDPYDFEDWPGLRPPAIIPRDKKEDPYRFEDWPGLRPPAIIPRDKKDGLALEPVNETTVDLANTSSSIVHQTFNLHLHKSYVTKAPLVNISNVKGSVNMPNFTFNKDQDKDDDLSRESVLTPEQNLNKLISELKTYGSQHGFEVKVKVKRVVQAQSNKDEGEYESIDFVEKKSGRATLRSCLKNKLLDLAKEIPIYTTPWPDEIGEPTKFYFPIMSENAVVTNKMKRKWGIFRNENDYIYNDITESVETHRGDFGVLFGKPPNQSLRHVMVCAEPGHGKTVLLKAFMKHCYLENQSFDALNIDVVLYLDLKLVDPLTKITVKDFLFDNSHSSMTKEEKCELFEFISNDGSTLIILDSLDDFPDDICNKRGKQTELDSISWPRCIIRDILNASLFPGALILSSATVECLNRLTVKHSPQRTVYLNGFEPILYDMIPNIMGHELGNKILTVLNFNHILNELSTVPFCLQFILPPRSMDWDNPHHTAANLLLDIAEFYFENNKSDALKTSTFLKIKRTLGQVELSEISENLYSGSTGNNQLEIGGFRYPHALIEDFMTAFFAATLPLQEFKKLPMIYFDDKNWEDFTLFLCILLLSPQNTTRVAKSFAVVNESEKRRICKTHFQRIKPTVHSLYVYSEYITDMSQQWPQKYNTVSLELIRIGGLQKHRLTIDLTIGNFCGKKFDHPYDAYYLGRIISNDKIKQINTLEFVNCDEDVIEAFIHGFRTPVINTCQMTTPSLLNQISNNSKVGCLKIYSEKSDSYSKLIKKVKPKTVSIWGRKPSSYDLYPPTFMSFPEEYLPLLRNGYAEQITFHEMICSLGLSRTYFKSALHITAERAELNARTSLISNITNLSVRQLNEGGEKVEFVCENLCITIPIYLKESYLECFKEEKFKIRCNVLQIKIVPMKSEMPYEHFVGFFTEFKKITERIVIEFFCLDMTGECETLIKFEEAKALVIQDLEIRSDSQQSLMKFCKLVPIFSVAQHSRFTDYLSMTHEKVPEFLEYIKILFLSKRVSYAKNAKFDCKRSYLQFECFEMLADKNNSKFGFECETLMIKDCTSLENANSLKMNLKLIKQVIVFNRMEIVNCNPTILSKMISIVEKNIKTKERKRTTLTLIYEDKAYTLEAIANGILETKKELKYKDMNCEIKITDGTGKVTHVPPEIIELSRLRFLNNFEYDGLKGLYASSCIISFDTVAKIEEKLSRLFRNVIFRSVQARVYFNDRCIEMRNWSINRAKALGGIFIYTLDLNDCTETEDWLTTLKKSLTTVMRFKITNIELPPTTLKVALLELFKDCGATSLNFNMNNNFGSHTCTLMIDELKDFQHFFLQNIKSNQLKIECGCAELSCEENMIHISSFQVTRVLNTSDDDVLTIRYLNVQKATSTPVIDWTEKQLSNYSNILFLCKITTLAFDLDELKASTFLWISNFRAEEIRFRGSLVENIFIESRRSAAASISELKLFLSHLTSVTSKTNRHLQCLVEEVYIDFATQTMRFPCLSLLEVDADGNPPFLFKVQFLHVETNNSSLQLDTELISVFKHFHINTVNIRQSTWDANLAELFLSSNVEKIVFVLKADTSLYDEYINLIETKSSIMGSIDFEEILKILKDFHENKIEYMEPVIVSIDNVHLSNVERLVYVENIGIKKLSETLVEASGPPPQLTVKCSNISIRDAIPFESILPNFNDTIEISAHSLECWNVDAVGSSLAKFVYKYKIKTVVLKKSMILH